MQQVFAHLLQPHGTRKGTHMSAAENTRAGLAVGEMCRALRIQAGLSLAQMARLTHRDTSTLSRFERGHTSPRDVDELVRAYRQIARPVQQRPQHSNRPRIWPLVYLAGSPVILTTLLLMGPAQWDADVSRAWVLASLLLILLAILPTVVSDARSRRHPVAIIARAGYMSALTLLATTAVRRWGDPMPPFVFVQAVTVVAFGMVTVAYDRLERENAPAE